MHRYGLACLIACLVLFIPAGTFAASPANVVTNPSCANNSISGWGIWPGTSAGCVQQDGQWWFDWTVPSPGAGGWDVYDLPTSVQAGQQFSCGFQAMGTGQIFLDFQSGDGDVDTPAVTLTSTPQTFKETVTLKSPAGGGWLYPPQMLVRYGQQPGSPGSVAPTGPLHVLFNDVTCVQASSVTLVSQIASTPAGSNSGAPATSASVPKTGDSPWTVLAGILALATGCGLLLHRRRQGSAPLVR